MIVEPEDESTPAVDESTPENTRELAAERIRFLFRLAGNNAPAVELEQQIMAYRLTERQP